MLDWVLIVSFMHHSLDDTLFLHLFIGPFLKHDEKLMTERHSVFSEKYALLKSKNMHRNVLNIRVCAVFDGAK